MTFLKCTNQTVCVSYPMSDCYIYIKTTWFSSGSGANDEWRNWSLDSGNSLSSFTNPRLWPCFFSSLPLNLMLASSKSVNEVSNFCLEITFWVKIAFTIQLCPWRWAGLSPIPHHHSPQCPLAHLARTGSGNTVSRGNHKETKAV